MPPPIVHLPLPSSSKRLGQAEPYRPRDAAAAPITRGRLVNGLLVFVAVLLLGEAFVGEKGFLETTRARREAVTAMERLSSLRQENARLREARRRLSEDPTMIEAEARQQLGLARPGEVMFILKDVRPANTTSPATER